MPRPIRSAFTIPYGAQYGAIRARGARTHTGCDYHAPIGTPIYGTENGGRVTGRYFAAGGYGYYVTVVYPSGRTMDAHMREHSPLPVGTPVGINTVVGYVGLTGNAATADPPGSHDHHERWNSAGARINPESRYGLEPSTAGNGSTEIDEMSAAAEKQIAEIHQAIFTTPDKPGGWAGINMVLGQVNKSAGETHQFIAETEQWEGIDARLTRVVNAVTGGASVQVDVAALAVALAPLLKAGATVADIEAALKDDFAAVKAAIPTKITAELSH